MDRIKLLAVDMDGTLLDSGSRVSSRNLSALRRAADAGILIVPTTGRALTCLPHRLAQERGLYRYVISSNGAQVTDVLKKQTIFQTLMARETAAALLQDCRGQRLGRMTHIHHQYMLEGRLFYLLGRLIYGQDARQAHRVRDMERTVRRSAYDVEEIQLYFLSQRAKAHVRRMMRDYPELSAAYTNAYAEIFSREASKGRALAALADSLHIAREEIACIGDGENDLSMFAVSGLRIAMGNAVPELKEAASVVTAANNRDGVARAIETYIRQ